MTVSAHGPVCNARVILKHFKPFEVTASVELHARDRDDPGMVIAFIPMTVIAVMRACRNDLALAPSFVSCCVQSARVLVDIGANQARELRLRDRLLAHAADDEAGAILIAGIPDVTGDVRGFRRREFRAQLLWPDGGLPYVDIFSRNGHLAAMGTLALFEHVAKTEDYNNVTARVGRAVLQILNLAEKIGASPVPDFDQATDLYQAAISIAAGDVS